MAAGLELGVAEDELVEPVAVEVGVRLEQLAHVALLVERGLELLVRVEHQPQVGRAAYPDELLRVLVEDLEQRGPAGAQAARCGRDTGEI